MLDYVLLGRNYTMNTITFVKTTMAVYYCIEVESLNLVSLLWLTFCVMWYYSDMCEKNHFELILTSKFLSISLCLLRFFCLIMFILIRTSYILEETEWNRKLIEPLLKNRVFLFVPLFSNMCCVMTTCMNLGEISGENSPCDV